MGSGMMGMMHMMGMKDNDCPMSGGNMQAMMSGNMASIAQARLDKLKSELSITTAQGPAWGTYAAAVTASANQMGGMRDTMMASMQSGPAKDRLAARISAMESMLKGLKALQPATEDLYKVLSPDQQKKADALLGAGCGMM
jgi:hypothetical protein